MIISEQIGDTRVRHYSDAGMMIRQVETGDIYVDAIDVIPCRYTYEETDIPLPTPEPEPEPENTESEQENE